VPFFFLFGFESSNQHAFNQTAWEEWLIGENKYIQGISVFGLCGRYKTKIVGKHHALGHNFGKLKFAARRVVFDFVSAAFWSLDDDVDAAG
jgi:hypothetical protein